MIVIGASAGGMPAIGKLLSNLGQDIPAAVAIVIHLPDLGNTDIFVSRLQKQTRLVCQTATNDIPLNKGEVFFAPSGRHMLIKKDRIILGNGPTESHWRPSIDTTMRSAAASWNSHGVGIILTGMLDDGTTGMEAIQRGCGYTLIQDPTEAECPEMPLSVSRNIDVDWCGPLQTLHEPLLDHLKKTARFFVPEELHSTSFTSATTRSIPGPAVQSIVRCSCLFKAPHRKGSPSMLITTEGVPSADAICATPVQLETSSEASLNSTPIAPMPVIPVISIAG